MKRKNAQVQSKHEGLADLVDLTLEQIFLNLMTAIDLAVALEREKDRLDGLATGSGGIELDELRVTGALLAALYRELDILRTDVDNVTGRVRSALIEYGLNPIVPESWCRSDSQFIRKERLSARSHRKNPSQSHAIANPLDD